MKVYNPSTELSEDSNRRLEKFARELIALSNKYGVSIVIKDFFMLKPGIEVAGFQFDLASGETVPVYEEREA